MNVSKFYNKNKLFWQEEFLAIEKPSCLIARWLYICGLYKLSLFGFLVADAVLGVGKDYASLVPLPYHL